MSGSRKRSSNRYVAVTGKGSPRVGQLLRHVDDPKRWLVRVFLARDAGNRRRYASRVVYGSRRDADAALLELLQQKGGGSLVPKSRLTVAELTNEWIEHKRRDVTERTLAGYEYVLRRYVTPHIGHRRITDVTLRDVDRLYGQMLDGGLGGAERPLSTRTVRLTHAALSQALSQAVKWGLLRFNPASEASVPSSSQREKDVLTVAERTRFLTACRDSFYGTFYRLLLDTGLRPGEACALRWSDVDFARETITVQRAVTRNRDGSPVLGRPKTPKSRRTVPMMSGLRSELLEHLERQRDQGLDASGFVFTNTSGQMLRPWAFSTRDLRRTTKLAGITKGVSLYSLRHTCATLHVAAGTHVKVVSELLGHANIQQTADTYMHGDARVTADAIRDYERTLGVLESRVTSPAPN